MVTLCSSCVCVVLVLPHAFLGIQGFVCVRAERGCCSRGRSECSTLSVVKLFCCKGFVPVFLIAQEEEG